jgi:hypothetical protein
MLLVQEVRKHIASSLKKEQAHERPFFKAINVKKGITDNRRGNTP